MLVYATREELKDPNKSRDRPIEEKESYRWLLGFDESNEVAKQCPDTLIVNVSDREGDIYELLMHSQETSEDKAHWLVRSSQNRLIIDHKFIHNYYPML